MSRRIRREPRPLTAIVLTAGLAVAATSSEAVRGVADFSIDRRLQGIDSDGGTSALRNATVHDPIRLGLGLVAPGEACPRAGKRPAALCHQPRLLNHMVDNR